MSPAIHSYPSLAQVSALSPCEVSGHACKGIYCQIVPSIMVFIVDEYQLKSKGPFIEPWGTKKVNSLLI